MRVRNKRNIKRTCSRLKETNVKYLLGIYDFFERTPYSIKILHSLAEVQSLSTRGLLLAKDHLHPMKTRSVQTKEEIGMIDCSAPLAEAFQ